MCSEKSLLIVNPVAGHGRGLKCFRLLESRILAAFPGIEVRMSEYPGHAVEIGRRAAGEGFTRVICLGGDGTPFEVLNGLCAEGRPDSLPELGLIPAGTGNSFLRDFDVTSADQALEGIIAGRHRAVDMVEFTYDQEGRQVRRVMINILGVGLIADILKLTNERLKGFGAMGYSLAVLIRLARGMRNSIDITADGRARRVKNSALVISNSKFTGGKMKIAPAAETADGLADLVVFREVNRREILAIFKGVFSGSHAAHPKVEMSRGSEITIDGSPPLLLMADGELLGKTPLTLKVLPGALTILA